MEFLRQHVSANSRINEKNAPAHKKPALN